MKVTNKQVVEECLVCIQLLQEHINAVNAAAYFVDRLEPHYNTTPVDFGNLRERLFNLELEEWRKLFMWALTLTTEEQDRIKAAAHDRFLNNKTYVAHWFTEGGYTGKWLVADEEEFREMTRKVFAPKEVK